MGLLCLAKKPDRLGTLAKGFPIEWLLVNCQLGTVDRVRNRTAKRSGRRPWLSPAFATAPPGSARRKAGSVASRYFIRQRFFTCVSPNLVASTLVFAVDDLTEDECQSLAKSVQHYFNGLETFSNEQYFFDLAPSAEEDFAAFINLKQEWSGLRDEIEGYGSSSPNSWQGDIHWVYTIASEHAEIIRALRRGQIPTVYLQSDGGHGFGTFACVDSLTWDEIETLEDVLGSELHEIGFILRVISDVDAARQPALFVKARLGWKQFEESLKLDQADENLVAAETLTFHVIEEIRRLREIPNVLLADDIEEMDEDFEADEAPSNVNGAEGKNEPIRADENLRNNYRDPTNYWRNVWLYEQRREGKTNAAILNALSRRGQEFAPLESENALRTAIETIALYHRWPVIKGRAGRPRTSDASQSC